MWNLDWTMPISEKTCPSWNLTISSRSSVNYWKTPKPCLSVVCFSIVGKMMVWQEFISCLWFSSLVHGLVYFKLLVFYFFSSIYLESRHLQAVDTPVDIRRTDGENPFQYVWTKFVDALSSKACRKKGCDLQEAEMVLVFQPQNCLESILFLWTSMRLYLPF